MATMNIETANQAREICNRSIIGSITKAEVQSLLAARADYLSFHAHGMPADLWNDEIYAWLHQAEGNCA